MLLPGTSHLQVAVWDWDRLGSNDLIGRTSIDLEDRFFSRVWQNLGREEAEGGGHAEGGGRPGRGRRRHGVLRKPMETRGLTTPGTKRYRGEIKCWLDILTKEECEANPAWDISKPPPRPRTL